MKDVFNKPCLSQASTRNSTMKLSQPLRRTNNGQHCISFLAPSVWNNMPNELKRCTNLNTFEHKVKECFLYKIREKDNDVLRSLRLDSWLHNNWCIFSLIFFFFFDILPYLSQSTNFSRTIMEIKQVECCSCVILATNWF